MKPLLVLDKEDALLKWAVLAVLLAGLSLVAACAETTGLTARLTTRPAVTADTAPPPSVRASRRGKAPSAAAMMGKSPQELKTLLGAPSLLREEAGAQVWQYANNHCVLLLYLYEDGADVFRVAHLEARIKGRRQPEADACLAATYNT